MVRAFLGLLPVDGYRRLRRVYRPVRPVADSLGGNQQLGETTQIVTRPKPRYLVFIGYGLALISLVYVFRDFHLQRTIREYSNVSWKWVFLGMLFDVVSYIMQSIRWKLLLTPFGRVRYVRSARSVFAGLFTNILFPLRPGELLRSYLLSTWEGIKFGRVLGSVGVERLVDLVVATAALAVASLFVELPRRFKSVADTLGVAALVLLAIVVGIILYLEFRMAGNPDLFNEQGKSKHHLPSRWMRALYGLHAMGTAPSFYSAVLFLGADAVLPGAGAVVADARVWIVAFISWRGSGVAGDQFGGFLAECAGECGVVPVFLRAGIERVPGGKIERCWIFDLRVSGAYFAAGIPGIRGVPAQRAIAGDDSRADDASSYRSAEAACLGASLPVEVLHNAS